MPKAFLLLLLSLVSLIAPAVCDSDSTLLLETRVNSELEATKLALHKTKVQNVQGLQMIQARDNAKLAAENSEAMGQTQVWHHKSDSDSSSSGDDDLQAKIKAAQLKALRAAQAIEEGSLDTTADGAAATGGKSKEKTDGQCTTTMKAHKVVGCWDLAVAVGMPGTMHLRITNLNNGEVCVSSNPQPLDVMAWPCDEFKDGQPIAAAGDKKKDKKEEKVFHLVEDIVSEKVWNIMFPRRHSNYTYTSFLNAVKKFPDFLAEDDIEGNKREAAMFFANIAHETSGDGYLSSKIDGGLHFLCEPCDNYFGEQTQCGQCGSEFYYDGDRLTQYYGRGPLQLTWKSDYKAATQAIGVDIVTNPSMVNTDPTVGFETALWLWMRPHPVTKHSCHAIAQENKFGFGETIQALNGQYECGKSAGSLGDLEMRHRIYLYKKFSQNVFKIEPGKKLSCKKIHWPKHQKTKNMDDNISIDLDPTVLANQAKTSDYMDQMIKAQQDQQQALADQLDKQEALAEQRATNLAAAGALLEESSNLAKSRGFFENENKSDYKSDQQRSDALAKSLGRAAEKQSELVDLVAKIKKEHRPPTEHPISDYGKQLLENQMPTQTMLMQMSAQKHTSYKKHHPTLSPMN